MVGAPPTEDDIEEAVLTYTINDNGVSFSLEECLLLLVSKLMMHRSLQISQHMLMFSMTVI